jgi:hypothetical protein
MAEIEPAIPEISDPPPDVCGAIIVDYNNRRSYDSRH